MSVDVTIAIPVYNVAPYVRKCLESIFAQDVNDEVQIEILIIDDGSTDDSMQIVTSALREAPTRFITRVVHHGHNLGLAEARNTAIRESEGEALWFVDSDDYVASDMLRLLYAEFDSQTDIVMSNVMAVSENGSKVDIGINVAPAISWSGMEALNALYSRQVYAFMWNKLIRRSLYNGVEFPPGKIYEDLAVMGYMFASARRVVQIPEQTYYYLIRDNAITSTYRPNVIQLIENVNHGIALAGQILPTLERSPLVKNYVVRESWIPVMNSVAKAGVNRNDSRTTVALVRREISLTACILLVRAGYFSSAAAAALIRIAPAIYMSIYRYIVKTRE